MLDGLQAYLTEQLGEDVVVTDLARISSVGNAREPWSFSARWRSGEVRAVMLVKAEAGQLETTLRPEFETIAGLAGSGIPVPRALWLEETGKWLGNPFFVTEWVPGTADTRPLRNPGDPDIRAVALALAIAAAKLHTVDVGPFGHLPATSVEEAAPQQLAYWHDLFLRQRLEAHPGLVYAVRWLMQRYPVARRVAVVHGDLRFGNALYDGGRLTALVDWEMTHLGDPMEDLGWAYRALWSPARSLPFEEFLAAYTDAGGGPIDREHLRWYEVFAEVKHSVISLTGTRSFADRATNSLRHADRSATVGPFISRILELVSETC